jgi:hypothetical protein
MKVGCGMEFVVVAAVIIVLLIVFGVKADTVLIGAGVLLLGIAALAVAAMTLLFIFFMGKLICSRPAKAEFSRVYKPEGGRFNTAFYTIDGREYQCIFPSEPKIMYRKKGKCRVFINRRSGKVFDVFSAATCTLGLLFCLAAVTAGAWLVITFVI